MTEPLEGKRVANLGEARPEGKPQVLGAYWIGRVLNDGFKEWWIIDPDGQIGTLGPNHTVVEHDDGTISVTPSIWDHPDGWHGWLKSGVWTSV